MLGLAVLFGLLVWIAITLLSIKVGANLFGQKKNLKYIGAFLGFMLTMGGFAVYWTVEYNKTQTYVESLCKSEPPMIVYIPPEIYKQSITTNKLEGLPSFTRLPSKDSYDLISFNGKVYTKRKEKYGSRIAIYKNSVRIKHAMAYRTLYVDDNTQLVLVETLRVAVLLAAIADSLEGLKFWMKNIQDCKHHNLRKSKSALIDIYREIIK